MSKESRRRTIALIHFLPLELYPPVMNFVNCWKQQNAGYRLDIYSTRLNNNAIPGFGSDNASIKITRMGTGNLNHFFKRWINYFIFYWGTFFRLLGSRPGTVFYFDTISSFPAWLYKKWYPSTRLFIHYHEYMSAKEYQEGMVLLKWFHRLEKKIYVVAEWISQTNTQRMELFEKDIERQLANKHIIPNYPPASWAVEKKNGIGIPVKIVYAGALGMDSLYLKEFATWVHQQQGRVLWDIFSQQDPQEVTSYFKRLASPYIRLMGYCNYFDLPSVFRNYDVGVILYKGHIPNYIYNAPNKLFEYHVCQLDSWFPQQMISARSYITTHTYPKIIALDFERMDNYELPGLIDRRGFSYNDRSFTAESAFSELVMALQRR